MVERARDLRDRLYLVLLLLIGAAAIASGLYYVLAQGDVSAPIVFDTAFGVALLLVAWLFLIPDSVPTGGDSSRERLTQVEPLAPEPAPVVRAPRPESTRRPTPPPRWTEASSVPTPPSTPEPVVAVRTTEPEPTPAPRARPPPREEPPPPTVPASEVIKELDEIYEDLQPAEPERESPPPLDSRRRRLGGPAVG
ncbi:MAG: hypothetical protein L3J87_02115 [Thermoplasmata archaeon]|nr:hypothetical protein [Thermoplasmata archaeon]MCI4344406.1 hypothetical protein [Thermoplasmata archaeon]